MHHMNRLGKGFTETHVEEEVDRLLLLTAKDSSTQKVRQVFVWLANLC